MASGILGGGVLQVYVPSPTYTTPPGKTTTTSLLLFGGGGGGTVSLSLGSVTIYLAVPANGIVTMTGIVLAAGQSVSLSASVAGINYLLTGWESVE